MIMNLHIEDKNIMYHKNKELETNLTKKLEKELNEKKETSRIEEKDHILNLKEALRLDYELNYIVSDLKLIASYYELSTRKLRKSQMIDMICDYELNEENSFFVEKRKLQWFYLKELQNDPFFKKYILIA
jgi:hypothetical protein